MRSFQNVLATIEIITKTLRSFWDIVYVIGSSLGVSQITVKIARHAVYYRRLLENFKSLGRYWEEASTAGSGMHSRTRELGYSSGNLIGFWGVCYAPQTLG